VAISPTTSNSQFLAPLPTTMNLDFNSTQLHMPQSLLFSDYLNENANISTRNHGEICSLAYSFRKHKEIMIVDGSIMLCSFGSLLCLYSLCKNQEIKKLWALIGQDLRVSSFVDILGWRVFGPFSAHCGRSTKKNE
jgi:hypothetical protein